jgi:hypothetical protein
MTAYQYAKGLVLPAPIGGMNTDQPIAAMDPSYATWMCNIDADNQFCRMRGGYRIHATIPKQGASFGGNILALGVFGRGSSSKMFAYAQGFRTAVVNAVFDVSTTTATHVYDTIDNLPDEVIWVNYKSSASFVVESTFSTYPTTADGTVWADGWVSSGGVKLQLGPSVWYKNRLYTAPSSGSNVYYGTVGQITGNITNPVFPVGEVFSYSSSIRFMGTFSASDGIILQEYIAFGNSYGEVLVYTGDYPGSSSFQLIGKFLIGEPIGYRVNCTIQYRNDCLVVTRTGLFSLRDLITKGNQTAVEQSVSKNINNYWIQLFSNYVETTSNTSANLLGVYCEEQKKIYILVPGHIDRTGVYSDTYATMFVYNTETAAWNLHTIVISAGVIRVGNLCCYKGEIYFAANMQNGSGNAFVIKLNRGLYSDELLGIPGTNLSYSFLLESAYAVYGDQQAVTKLGSYQPIVKHDLPSFAVGARIDFGLKTVAITSPNAPSGVSKPTTSASGEGSFFQYTLTGSGYEDPALSTTGFEFYSMNATLQKGGPLS